MEDQFYKPEESMFSPRRWFIGPDHLVRPGCRVFLYVVAGIVASILSIGAIQGIRGVLPGVVLQILGYGLTNMMLLLAAWMMCTAFDQRSFRSVGVWFYSGWLKEAAIGIGLGVGLIAIVAGGLIVANAYSKSNPTLPSGASPWTGIAAYALILLLAGACEELMFRGYAFQRLIDSVGRLGAVLILSAFFGAVHLRNPGNPTALSTLNTVLAGVLLAVAYLKTRGLWLSIGLHWTWNFTMGPVLGMPVSGTTIEPSLFKYVPQGQIWLSGGTYGPEGSIVLTVVCTGAIIWLWRSTTITPSPAMAEVLQLDRGKQEWSASDV